MKEIYLDNAATTKPHPDIVNAMMPYLAELHGNAGSIHRAGRKAKKGVEDSRDAIAQAIGASHKEIIFTSGATESDNLAITGVARALKEKGNHLIISAIEHPAVIQTCEQLEAEGFQTTRLPVDNTGHITLDDLSDAITEKTILISIMAVNNEVGTIQPIEQIGEMAHKHGILFHTDAVQGIGKIHIDLSQMPIDLLSLSGHKLYGPKGIGALYIRTGTPLSPLIHGGGQEFAKRAGTSNVPGIIGLGQALTFVTEHQDQHRQSAQFLRTRLLQGLQERVSNIHFNGSTEHYVPNILNISFANVGGEAVILSLDAQGIYVSSGSACSSESMEPSPVLLAMGLSRLLTKSAIRFSLAFDTSAEDVDHVLETLPPIIERLRALSPL